MSLDYADRAERYLGQRGITYDPQRMSWDRLTPAQRRRALKKERMQYRRLESVRPGSEVAQLRREV